MSFIRKNAWSTGGNFTDAKGAYTDLYWYAKGVEGMMARQLDDPTSWWFYAAIHGQYVITDLTSFPYWGAIPPVPNVPTSPIPPPEVVKMYWDQCQHGQWFFPPWHRGYLYGLENILREIIIKAGGPGDWALPYWNYLGGGNQYQIPPAFTAQTMPDGTTPNPLFVTARYGPTGDGHIYVQIPPVSEGCQNATYYTNGYGGAQNTTNPESLESNPHNFVHSQVGGYNGRYGGLMGNTGLAGLDPVFYLHHCNIDRMWAVWNEINPNPTVRDWIDGPTANGERRFYMPQPDGTPWNFTPGMVTNILMLNYMYDDLLTNSVSVQLNKTTSRLRRLGKVNADAVPANMMKEDAIPELVGASTEPLELGASGGHTTVKLDNKGWQLVNQSLAKASEKTLPDTVILQLEGIKGTPESNRYIVAVNHRYAGHISMFGLRKASMKDGHHGGAGLTIQLDISSIVDELHLNNQDVEQLQVLIQPDGPIVQDESCTIERIGIYRVES